jgi:hypothetical protein
MRTRKSIPISWLLAGSLLVAAMLLATTGWKGGELVYRHGLGVMSLPSKSKHEHDAHDHDGGRHVEEMSNESMLKDSDVAHEVGEHDHGHVEHDHDEASSSSSDEASGSDSSAEDQSESKPPAITEEPKNDGHNHDHGDLPH